nr:MAG TPA: hypothetical protein [Bacteriophage sp.]
MCWCLIFMIRISVPFSFTMSVVNAGVVCQLTV